MILIRKATFDEVPILSLQGWKLHGAPIVEQYIYGSVTDCRGWPHQGHTDIYIYQTMKKEIEISIKYEKDILEYINHLENEKYRSKEHEHKLIISNIEKELNKHGCRIVYDDGEYVLRWSFKS